MLMNYNKAELCKDCKMPVNKNRRELERMMPLFFEWMETERRRDRTPWKNIVSGLMREFKLSRNEALTVKRRFANRFKYYERA
tara:strand:- start:836 stop:1084 length:249 start_codon:yes stop_codon:yes gene_type:complete